MSCPNWLNQYTILDGLDLKKGPKKFSQVFTNQSESNNICIANCHGNILQKNVLKGGENNSQFMTRESEARSCAQKQTR